MMGFISIFIALFFICLMIYFCTSGKKRPMFAGMRFQTLYISSIYSVCRAQTAVSKLIIQIYSFGRDLQVVLINFLLGSLRLQIK